VHEGFLIIPAVQVDPAQRKYWRTGSKRGPPLLGHGNHEESMRDLIVCRGHGWGGPRLSGLWGLRADQKVASPAFGWHRGVPQP
jgi:hypothetical protein